MLADQALLEEALGFSVAKVRAEVAFGATRTALMRVRGGGSDRSGLGAVGRLGARFGGC